MPDEDSNRDNAAAMHAHDSSASSQGDTAESGTIGSVIANLESKAAKMAVAIIAAGQEAVEFAERECVAISNDYGAWAQAHPDLAQMASNALQGIVAQLQARGIPAAEIETVAEGIISVILSAAKQAPLVPEAGPAPLLGVSEKHAFEPGQMRAGFEDQRVGPQSGGKRPEDDGRLVSPHRSGVIKADPPAENAGGPGIYSGAEKPGDKQK